MTKSIYKDLSSKIYELIMNDDAAIKLIHSQITADLETDEDLYMEQENQAVCKIILEVLKETVIAD